MRIPSLVDIHHRVRELFCTQIDSHTDTCSAVSIQKCADLPTAMSFLVLREYNDVDFTANENYFYNLSGIHQIPVKQTGFNKF